MNKHLALVFRTEDGNTYVGMFDETGDIEVFAPFTSDKSFDILALDCFGICEYSESDQSDFTLKLLGEIQVKIVGDDEGVEATAKNFVEDPERKDTAFRELYEFVLENFKTEMAASEAASEPRVLH